MYITPMEEQNPCKLLKASLAGMYITPTEEQNQLLSKPWKASLAGLEAADFLARQDYIDWWIKDWLKETKLTPDELPLCVSESFHCDDKLCRILYQCIRDAIVRGDVSYVKKHNLIPNAVVWNYVDFETVTDDMFRILAVKSSIPQRLCPFVVAPQRLAILKVFVDKYGATTPLRDAICHQWVEAVKWLLEEGAEIEGDCMGLSVRHPEIFKLMMLYNPPAKEEDWKEFLLQYTLKRVPDVPLVEEWFWCNGFKL